MNISGTISESEASEIAGVSSKTLNRFVEAGYLRTDMDENGKKLYRRNELHQLFGIQDPVEIQDPERPSSRLRGFPRKEVRAKSPSPLGAQDSESTRNTIQETTPKFSDAKVPAESVSSSLNDQIETTVESENAPDPEVLASTLREEARAENNHRHEAELTALEMEVKKLQNILSLQERILEMKDTEIKDLREQRSWLQNRIEALDDKSTRDQLLLVSETQLISKLLTKQSEKRSPFRLALEWLGLKTEPADIRESESILEVNRRT